MTRDTKDEDMYSRDVRRIQGINPGQEMDDSNWSSDRDIEMGSLSDWDSHGNVESVMPVSKSVAQEKLHLADGGGDKDNFHRWVVLQNSIVQSSSVTATAAVTGPPSPSVYSLDGGEDEPDDEVGSEECDSFMFSDARNSVDSHTAVDNSSEAEWLDSLLETISDEDDDEFTVDSQRSEDSARITPSIDQLAAKTGGALGEGSGPLDNEVEDDQSEEDFPSPTALRPRFSPTRQLAGASGSSLKSPTSSTSRATVDSQTRNLSGVQRLGAASPPCSGVISTNVLAVFDEAKEL
jgi:hypothetical protein